MSYSYLDNCDVNKVFETISVVLMTIAVGLFLFAIMGGSSSLTDPQSFNWKAPMLWSIMFALCGLVTKIVAYLVNSNE